MALVAFDYEILVLSLYLLGTGVKIKLYQDSIDNNYLNFWQWLILYFQLFTKYKISNAWFQPPDTSCLLLIESKTCQCDYLMNSNEIVWNIINSE